MSANSRKGARWEQAVVDFLRPLHPRAERRVSNGVNDRGDVAGIDGWVVECKSCERLELAAWADEAQREALAAGVPRWAVVARRRGKSTAQAYAVVPLWMLAELMLPDQDG